MSSSKVILTGASGKAGSAVLLQLLHHPHVTRISLLARQPLHPDLLGALPAEAVRTKLNLILMDDFTVYPPEVMAQLEGHESCIWTLGISYALVDKDEYRRLTFDYAVAAAKAFSPLSPNFRFVFVSGQGTSHYNLSPGMRIKAQTEDAIAAVLGPERTFLFRPGVIVPPSPRMPGVRVRNPLELRAEAMAPVVERWMPSMVVSTVDLAGALIETALHGKNDEGKEGARVVGNSEIRAWGRKVREAGGEVAETR